MPSEQLMQAEWKKPDDYFQEINKIYSKTRLPTNINEILNNQTISKRQRRQAIKDSFLLLNPPLTSEQIDVIMTHKGRKLKEVALSYDHQFIYINCN